MTAVRGRRVSALFTAAALMLSVLVLQAVEMVVNAPPASASHFRAAQLSWHRQPAPNSNPRAVEFHFSSSFRRSYPWPNRPCSAPSGSLVCPESQRPNVGDQINTGMPIYFEGSNGAVLGNTGAVVATVVSVDTANDVLIADAHIPWTFPTNYPASVFASFENCCRSSLPLHRNNPDGAFRVSTLVNYSVANDRSPTSGTAPIIDCPVSALCQFFVPASDGDGGVLAWRLASGTEAGSGPNGSGPFLQPAGASVNATTGLYQWNTAAVANNLNPTGDSLFSTQVVIEKRVGTVAVSSVAVDFFLRVTSTASPNRAPTFDSPTPPDGTVLTTQINTPVSFDTSATDPDAGATVSLGMIGKPASAAYSTTAGNPATGTFSWTPTATGDTILTLTAQDEFGRGATARSVIIRTINDLAPVVSVPADMTLEATGPGGATATYAATAEDDADGALTPSCSPASSSVFPIGTTQVTCSATDSGGKTGSATFNITVSDTTAPALSVPASQTIEATGPDGAVATFTASATDAVDGDIAPVCTPASGTTFPIGTSTVACAATDAAGNTSNGSFSVTVQDTTAPVVTYSGNQGTYTVDQMITITCTATDAVGVASSTCQDVSAPASSFAAGVHTLSASATDAAGNVGSATTSFTVLATAESLCRLTEQYVSNADIAHSLCVKLRNGQAAADRGNTKGANTQLKNYQNEVNAQSGKSITPENAATLIRFSQELAASWR